MPFDASALIGRTDAPQAAPLGRKRPDYRLNEFVLDPENRAIDRLNIAGAIIGEPSLELTMDGASTITIPVEDSTGKLLTGDFLTGWTWGRNADTKIGRYPNPAVIDGPPVTGDEAAWVLDGRPIEATLDDWRFRLQRIDDTAPVVQLVLEDVNAARMRDHRGTRKVYRDNMTRLQFCVRLAYAAGVQKIWAPEAAVRQPEVEAEPISRQRTRATSTRGKLSGPLYGKEGKLGPGQLHNAEVALDQAMRDKSPERATLALLCACIVEAPDFKNPTGGEGTSQGILQLTAGKPDRRNIPSVVHRFLTVGFYGKRDPAGKGAIDLARRHPTWTVGEIAQETQGSGFPGRYQEHVGKAQKILAAYSGKSGAGARAGERQVRKPFELARGRNENSWDATGRLLGDIGARRFTRGGYVFLVSDTYLWGWPPQFTLEPGAPGVDSIGGEIDLRARNLVAQITAKVHVDRWAVWPGIIVRVRGKGPEDGLWIVQSVRRPLNSTLAEVTLRKPMPLKKEPAADTESASDRNRRAVGGGSALEKAQLLYRACQQFDGPYHYGGGHGKPLRTLSVGTPMDCSSSTSLALYRAKLFGGRTTALVSGGFSGYGQKGPGRYVTIWYHGGHVYIEFKIPGYHGKRFDTGGPGGGAGPRVRNQSRSHAGFSARHPPGL